MRISIALTTFNGERFLKEQLDSLYAQTILPDEIVVCDDASTDHTQTILEEYHKQHGLKYHINPKSLGVNNNFFKAISLCQGDYILICDQDDIWLPNKVEVLYKTISSADDGTPIAVSSLRQDIDAQGRPIQPAQQKPYGEKWKDTLLSTSRSQGCTMIINKNLAELSVKYYTEKHSQADKVMYDVLISVIAAIFGKKINLPDVLMQYRHHDSNVVDKLRDRNKTFWLKVREMPSYYPFLLDYRIQELSLMNSLLDGEKYPDDIRVFMNKMWKLSNTHSMIKGLYIILSLPQIQTVRKMKILMLTPIVKTLKWFDKHFIMKGE